MSCVLVRPEIHFSHLWRQINDPISSDCQPFHKKQSALLQHADRSFPSAYEQIRIFLCSMRRGEAAPPREAKGTSRLVSHGVPGSPALSFSSDREAVFCLISSHSLRYVCTPRHVAPTFNIVQISVPYSLCLHGRGTYDDDRTPSATGSTR